jgi:hypothetical protein
VGHKSVHVCAQNALKHTYEHLLIQNFPGVISRTPQKGEGKGGEVRGGEGREEVCCPNNACLSTPLCTNHATTQTLEVKTN